MSLREAYEEAWRERYGLPQGWIVNPEPGRTIALGAIGTVDDTGFQYDATLAGRGIGQDLPTDPHQQRQDNPWSFQSHEEIKVGISAAAEVPGAGPVGDAAFDVDISFGRTAGVSVYGDAKWFSGYADVGVVRTVVVEAARKDLLFKGDSIVVTQQLSGPGLMFLAEGRDAEIHVRGSARVGPGQLPPISKLSGSLGVVSSSGGARYEVVPDGAVLAVRVLQLGRRGFFWWRRFVAYGAAYAADLDQIEETHLTPVEGEGEHEYFALL